MVPLFYSLFSKIGGSCCFVFLPVKFLHFIHYLENWRLERQSFSGIFITKSCLWVSKKWKCQLKAIKKAKKGHIVKAVSENSQSTQTVTKRGKHGEKSCVLLVKLVREALEQSTKATSASLGMENGIALPKKTSKEKKWHLPSKSSTRRLRQGRPTSIREAIREHKWSVTPTSPWPRTPG